MYAASLIKLLKPDKSYTLPFMYMYFSFLPFIPLKKLETSWDKTFEIAHHVCSMHSYFCVIVFNASKSHWLLVLLLPGFAGHVPFYKDLGGHGFPVVTNQSLREFTKERERHLGSADKPLNKETIGRLRPPRPTPTFVGTGTKNDIFLIDSGIIPRYSGYVPGKNAYVCLVQSFIHWCSDILTHWYSCKKLS